MKLRALGCLFMCAVVPAVGSVRAETEGEAEESIRVYTNEDLERFAPLPVQRVPLVRFDKERWEYVIQFLEREHARLNADRSYDLARAILRAEVEAAEKRPRYSLALAPYHGFHRRPHRHGHRPVQPPPDSFATPEGQRIVPLHARPSRARLHFDRATGHASN